MMQNDASRGPAEQAGKKKWQAALSRIWGTVTHQWGWKVTSLVLAICLWGGLISQDTSLPREKVIEGVRIAVSNAAVLRNNGMIVVSGLDDMEEVTVRVQVPQRNYATASASNYSARADLSQIQSTGTQTVRLTASAINSNQYGSVIDIETPELTVEVEEYVTQTNVPVEVRVVGEAPEAYYPGDLSRNTDAVDLSGPKSVVEAAVRCVVEYDMSDLSPSRNPNAANLPFYFEDVNGNRLDGSKLTVNVSGQSTVLQRISVSQPVYYMAQVPVDVDSLISGEPAEGYVVSGIRVTPQTITIAGSETAITPYLDENMAFFVYDPVDVSGQSRNISVVRTLRTPGNVDYISNNMVQVAVTILPEAYAELLPAEDTSTENPE